MRNKIYAFALIFLCTLKISAQTYNTLWIPDTLIGTTFNLNLVNTFKQIVPTGNQTITAGINNN